MYKYTTAVVSPTSDWHLAALDVHARTQFLCPSFTRATWRPVEAVIADIIFSTSTHLFLRVFLFDDIDAKGSIAVSASSFKCGEEGGLSCPGVCSPPSELSCAFPRPPLLTPRYLPRVPGRKCTPSRHHP